MRPIDNRCQSGRLIIVAVIIIGILIAVFMAIGYHGAGSPRFCVTCHSMEHVGNRWQQSYHKQFACIECHLPNSNFIVQATYKARAGLNDLFHETLRTYPAAILISSEGKGIAQGNCLRCHYSTIENTPMARQGGECLKCHHNLVHGRGLEKGGMKVE
ncbi:MAG: NapC/NirT family cytochrome c [Proteobacteria bacterium]|nr:NapC/NirT family cytochrome c [Pseudomonadota bacterium]